MAQPYKGRRVKLTVRLPYDLFEAAAQRADARRWTMSGYIGWCVERQINPIGAAARERRDPDIDPTPAATRSRRRRAPLHGRVTDADPSQDA